MLTDKHDPIPDCDCQACALAERDKLRAEVAELDALRDRLADLLTRTAVALRGPQPAMGRHSWHDLPERAAAAIAAIAFVQVAERDRCAKLCETWMEGAERGSGPEAAGWLYQMAQHMRGLGPNVAIKRLP